MIIVSVTALLSIPSAFSLKDKRMVLRSILARTRQGNYSAAETGHQDLHQTGELSFVFVAAGSRQADVMAQSLRDLLEAQTVRLGAEITSWEQDILQGGFQ